ncbi:MAG: hypothetical protein RMK01_00925 [Thermomicrobium sp.]|nr:hypothetical protein [Thermomicrobium sp.]
MASAGISTPLRRPHPRATEELRLVELSWRQQAMRVALFSVPFLAVALYGVHLGFLSNAHAHIVAKSLLAADRLRLEVIGFLYPPLPFLTVLLYPRAWTPAVLGSVAAGATAWIVWYDLERAGLPRLWRMLLLAAVVATPSSLFLATQAYPDMLALHLVIVAWHYYQNFIRYQHTFSGFVAGLVLGLAFYAHFYALLYGLALALLVPLYRRLENRTVSTDERWATVSQMLVTAFPVLWAATSWTYINWVFTGNPLTYLADPAAAVFDPARWQAPLDERVAWLPAFGRELVAQVLLLGSALLVAWRQPRQLLPLAALALFPVVIRLAGLNYAAPLALGTYTLIALVALPERLPRWVAPILVVLAIAQGALNATLVAGEPEVEQWERVVTTGQPQASDLTERAFAERLAAAPARSILTDDRSSYRLIARAETAHPFLLPADAEFARALEQPRWYVRYILVDSAPAGRDLVSERFGERPPENFVVDGGTGRWIVYRREDAPSLFAEP